MLVSSLETALLHIFLLLWDVGCSWKELVLAEALPFSSFTVSWQLAVASS